MDASKDLNGSKIEKLFPTQHVIIGKAAFKSACIVDAATIFVIAVGLAMDAFSVSIAYGMTTNGKGKNNALKIASSFGAFQMFMPLLGWLAGFEIIGLIAGFDHWLAFGLLILSISTSMDALAIGLSFAILKVSIATPAIVIGTVTFTLSLIGAILGDRLRRFRPDKIEILGGLILIVIGVKILLKHLALG